MSPLDTLFTLAAQSGEIPTPARADQLQEDWKRACIAAGPEEINARNDEGDTAANVLARRAVMLRLFDIGLETGMDFGGTDSRGQQPIHAACLRDRSEDPAAAQVIDWLIDVAGMDVNAEVPPGWTPLHLACCRTDAARVRLLLRKGAHLEAVLDPEESALTPLLLAVQKSCDGVVLELMLAGADRSRTAGGKPAWRLALSNNRIRSGDIHQRLKDGFLPGPAVQPGRRS